MGSTCPSLLTPYLNFRGISTREALEGRDEKEEKWWRFHKTATPKNEAHCHHKRLPSAAMNYSPSSPVSPFNGWDTSAEMLASSMMLVSISEDEPTTIGYQARTPSGGLSQGWGNSMSRKSYKTNLNDLASQCSMEMSDDCSSGSSSQDADEWGFFIDSA